MSGNPRPSDRALVAAAAAGDTHAFAAVLSRCSVTIDRCLSRLLARWPEAQPHRPDLLQSLELHLVRADYRALRSFRGEARLTTWMHAVATRHFYGEIRAIARAARRPPAELGMDVSPSSPEQAVARAERAARVRSVLEGLPDQDRLLVGLLFDQDLDAVQAGRILGLKPSGVRMRKKRLLDRLAVKLKGLWP